MTTDNVVARTVKGFCQAYGVGVTTCYKLISERKIEARKAGTRKTLITEASAKAWYNGLAREPTRVPDAVIGEGWRRTAKRKSLRQKGKRTTAKVGE